MTKSKRVPAILLALLLVLLLLPACELKPAAPFQLGPYREGGGRGERQRVLGNGDVHDEIDINADMRGEEWTLRIEAARFTPGVAKIIIDESLSFAGKLETDSNLREAGLTREYNLSRREIVLRGKPNQWYAPTVLNFSVGVPVNRIIVNGAVKIEYDCPSVTECGLELNGAVNGNFKFGALKALRVDINGTGDCMFFGTSQRAEIELNGAAQVKAFGLTARDAAVTINGAGECEITAEDILRAEINGVGSVIYDGDPRVDRAVHGLGSVRKR